jgi:hypothetical protein
MGEALRELIALFEIEVDSSKLGKAHSKIDEFKEGLKSFGKGAFWAEVAHESYEFFKGQVEGAAHIQDLAERLDVGATEIKAFGFAAQSAGVNVDDAAHSLSILQRNIGLSMTGSKEQAKAFAKLGVPLKDAEGRARPLLDVVGDMADAFQSMPDQATRAAAAMHTFGRSGAVLLPVLSQGREKVEELFKESKELGSGLGGDFYKNSKAAREEFEHFGYAVQALKERALAAALPYLVRLGHFFTEAAKDVIAFTKHTTVLSLGMVFLGSVATVKLIGSLHSLAKAMGLLEAETLLPIVGLALLYVAFDDLFTFIQGGKSIIGDAIDAMFGEGSAAKIQQNAAAMEGFKFAGEAAAVGIITAFNPVLGMFAALALAATKAAEAIDQAKHAGETDEEHVARMQRESPENRAAWKKIQEESAKQREKDQKDYASGKKKGSVAVGPITTSADAYGPHGEANPLRDRAGMTDNEKAYQLLLARQYGGPTPSFDESGRNAPIPGHGGPGRAAHVEHNVNYETHVDVHTASDKPREVGRQVGNEVDRVHKKNANSSLIALTEP